MFCPTTNRRFVPMARMSWIKLSRRWLATYTGMKKAEHGSVPGDVGRTARPGGE